MTTLTSPHDLLAAVPFLVGYQPENSLVLISLKGDSVGLAMRIDFPEDVDPDQIDQLACHAVREGATAALLVSYLPQHISSGEYLLTPLREALELRAIKVRECLEIRHDRWRSLLCQDRSCCPTEGNPMPEFLSSQITAEQVVAGRRLPFKDLKDLKSSLEAFPNNSLVTAALSSLTEIDYEGLHIRQQQREGAQAIKDVLAQFMDQGFVADSNLTALVLVRLKDLQVRDFAMGMTTVDQLDLFTSFWLWMMKSAPDGYVAPVATLFAATAYENGDGSLAQRALDRAFADDANYSLAKLLRRVFAAGWPPESFADMRAELHPKICASLFGE